MFKRQIKYFLERLSGCEIERHGKKSFILVDKKHRADAWFSHRAQIRSMIEKYNINLVIDVGAHQGRFAQGLRSFYAGEILSFEPTSSVFDQLAATASSDPNWHVYKFALGSQESRQRIHVSHSTVFSSLLKTNDYCARRFGNQALTTKEEYVSVCRLDDILQDIVPDVEDKRIFLKLDTQGYDTEVFKGLGNKLQYVVLLQSEVSVIPIYEGMPHWTESISTYEKAGFGVISIFPVTRDSDRVVEYDCLFVRVAP